MACIIFDAVLVVNMSSIIFDAVLVGEGLNYLVSITLLLKCISKKRNKIEQESFKILQEFIHGNFTFKIHILSLIDAKLMKNAV